MEPILPACISPLLLPNHFLMEQPIPLITFTKSWLTGRQWSPWTPHRVKPTDLMSIHQKLKDLRTGPDCKSPQTQPFPLLHLQVDFSKLRCFWIPRLPEIAGVPQHVGPRVPEETSRTHSPRSGHVRSITSKRIQMSEWNEENCCTWIQIKHTHTHTEPFLAWELRKDF